MIIAAPAGWQGRASRPRMPTNAARALALLPRLAPRARFSAAPSLRAPAESATSNSTMASKPAPVLVGGDDPGRRRGRERRRRARNKNGGFLPPRRRQGGGRPRPPGGGGAGGGGGLGSP